MKRIFNVRLNLDDMAAGLDACCTDTEVAQWVRGFRVGVRGAALPDGVPRPMVDGHALGLGAYQEASTFQEKQAEKGRASAESRKSKTNHGSTTVQPEFNHGSTTVRTNPQSTIDNPISTSDNRGTVVAEDDLFSASPAEIARATAPPPKPVTDPHNWLDWRRDHPQVWINRTGEDGDLEAWKHLWGTYNTEAFSIMYTTILKTMPTGKRIGYGQAAEWLSKNCE